MENTSLSFYQSYTCMNDDYVDEKKDELIQTRWLNISLKVTNSVATILIALRNYLVDSTNKSVDVYKNHLYLVNNFYYMYVFYK